MNFGIPVLVPDTAFPLEPLDLSAEQTYALINDGDFPLELHGDPSKASASYPLSVGMVSARRGAGGKILFTINYRSTVLEQLVAELAAFNEMTFAVLGSGWAYKAVLGVVGWHMEETDRGARSIPPMVVSMLDSKEERQLLEQTTAFAKQINAKKGVHVLRVNQVGTDVITTTICFGARTIGDLDKIHRQVVEYGGKLKGGEATWVRNQAKRQLTLIFQGNKAFTKKATAF